MPEQILTQQTSATGAQSANGAQQGGATGAGDQTAAGGQQATGAQGQQAQQSTQTGNQQQQQTQQAVTPTTYDLKPSKPGALPEAAIKQVAEIAKDLGLSQDAAQKLLARHEASFAAHQAARAQQADAWYEQIAADKELGGANLQKTIDAARKGMSILTDAERAAITDGGYQNHPILVKVLAKLGGLIGEGGIGGTPTQQNAQKLFPSMPNP